MSTNNVFRLVPSILPDDDRSRVSVELTDIPRVRYPLRDGGPSGRSSSFAVSRDSLLALADAIIAAYRPAKVDAPDDFEPGAEVEYTGGGGCAIDFKPGTALRVLESLGANHVWVRDEDTARTFPIARFSLRRRGRPAAPHDFKAGDAVEYTGSSFADLKTGAGLLVQSVVGHNVRVLDEGTDRVFSIGKGFLRRAAEPARNGPVQRVDASRVQFTGQDLATISPKHLRGAFVNVIRGERAPTVAFGDLAYAEREADRLATTNPNKSVLTLKVEAVRTARVTTTIEKE
jgi:hypothetical protein